MHTIDQIVTTAIDSRASDIHISCGIPIKFRIDGRLVNFDDRILTDEDCIAYARELTPHYERIAEIGELDASVGVRDTVRCRINIYKERGNTAIAMRIVRDDIPTMQQLGLPEEVNQMVMLRQGLVLVTGPTGSGKSTTMAYMINRINHIEARHIVTFEEPIEFVYRPDKSIINQREIGLDTQSLENGLMSVLREDPDVILIGELRTPREIELALTVAETGHLVIATLHTNSSSETVDRIVDVFPAEKQAQIRMQLSMTLRSVISQQLLPHICGKGRVLATEVMMMTPAIANLIREGKTPQIRNCIATGAGIGSHLMDTSLIDLFNHNSISREEALRAAHDVGFVARMIKA